MLYIFIETPAVITFTLSPLKALTVPHPYASGVIHQYALIIWCSTHITATFIFRPQSIGDGAWLLREG